MDLLILPILAAFVAAITFFSGFGLGTVLMPVFALFFPIEVAIAATAVVHLVNNLFKIALVGTLANRGVVLRFGVPAVVAAMVGAAMLALMAPAAPLAEYTLGGVRARVTIAKIIVSAMLAVFAALELVPWYQRLAFGPGALPVGGVLSGFFGGLTGMQGPMRAPFLLRAGLGRDEFVGTTNVISTGVDLARLGMYALGFVYLARTHDYGVLAEGRTLGLVGATCAAGCAGSYVGRRSLEKVTMRGVRVVVAVGLFVVAALLGAGVV
ncbi:MAG TPA: TSUP family transporter [Phycisphaerales bacterium]|nr:TSUP family transporter [Phycisphaerales bacterium]